MRKVITSFLVVALLCVAASTANAAFSIVSIEASLTKPTGLSWIQGTAESSSAAQVEDSMGNSAAKFHSSRHYTDALATIISATQFAETKALKAKSVSSALPPIGYTSWASGSAVQTLDFEITSAGDKAFKLSWALDADMGTDFLNEWASGGVLVTLTVRKPGDSDITQTFTWSGAVYDGDDLDYSQAGQLIITRYYGLGATGSVTLSVQSNAAAHIPAPGALLLGGLGTCIAGWIRRRERAWSDRETA